MSGLTSIDIVLAIILSLTKQLVIISFILMT